MLTLHLTTFSHFLFHFGFSVGDNTAFILIPCKVLVSILQIIMFRDSCNNDILTCTVQCQSGRNTVLGKHTTGLPVY